VSQTGGYVHTEGWVSQTGGYVHTEGWVSQTGGYVHTEGRLEDGREGGQGTTRTVETWSSSSSLGTGILNFV
jgi:hypothetical protein